MRNKDIEDIIKDEIIENLINLKGERVLLDFLDGEGIDNIEELYNISIRSLKELEKEFEEFIQDY